MPKRKHSKPETRNSKLRAADLLFEIGTEELPAAYLYLPSLIEQLGRKAEFMLKLHHLDHQQVESFGTPRRLVLIVRGLSNVQRKPSEEIRGPTKHAAYGADGQPTPALLGFLRSRGGTLEQTKIISSNKGEYIYLVKPPTEKKTIEILATPLSLLINQLQTPKTMRWDSHGVRFARPIRWLLALYGSKLIAGVSLVVRDPQEPIDVLNLLRSSSRTRIGRPQALQWKRVTSFSAYFQMLTRAGVILNQGRRRVRIEQLVKEAAKREGGVPAPEVVSHGLLDEVTHLVERPVPLVGRFDRKYMVLPRELLLASMAKYQRVFALQTSAGKLLPTFVAILDGTPTKIAQVRQMYEHILNARLADSLLFWEQDHKQLPLSRMAGQLKDITFHERLGSMVDKSDRLHKFSAVLERAWNLSREQLADLRRACELAKADLVSTVVKEFPTLQGIVGKYYALDSKESPVVAEAIREHYLPSGNQSPQTLIGSALAILDKYDTLCSYFAIGIEPTGDQDPFGLRRAAQGIVEVAWAIHQPLPLDQLLQARAAMGRFAEGQADPDIHRNRVRERIRTYLAERLYTFAWPKPVPPRDLIDAVLSSPWDDLIDAMERIRHLRQLDGNQTLLRAAKVVERTTNILKGAPLKQDRVDPARFQEPLERELWQLYDAQKDRIGELIRGRAYAEATKAYGETFYAPLHEFFDKVMVNVPDEALRQNRLALMKAINVLYTDRIADLSKLAVLQPRQLSASPIVLNHERS